MITPKTLLASIALLAATSATAQDQSGQTTTPGDLSIGEEATQQAQPGDAYVREEYGDWDLRCIRGEQETDPCQLYQLLNDEGGNSVAEISLFRLQGAGRAEAGATVVVPLETLLTAQAVISVDGGAAKRYPYSFCNQVGCYARIGLTAEDIAAYKGGSVATLTIVPFAAPDQTVELDISLNGFTAGYENVTQATVTGE